MERTAEEFVHQLASGSWIVADYPGSTGGDRFKLPCVVRDHGNYRLVDLTDAEAQASRLVHKYTTKGAAKRAAQRIIEHVLDEPA